MANVFIQTCPVCDGNNFAEFLKVNDHSISGEDFGLIRCTDCGLVITQNHPDEESIGKYYNSEDYISHSDTKSGIVNTVYHSVRSYMLGQKRKLVAGVSDTGKLLDIGAGTGYFAAHMVDNNWEVVALEPDAGARQVARDNFNLDVHDVDHLEKLPHSTFDVVTMWHVLEHVHRLNATIHTINSVLKPNGKLIIAVPNYTARDAERYGRYWAAYDVPRHLWHFSPNAMRKLLSKHGFTVNKIRPMDFDAFYVSMLSEKYKGRGSGFVGGTFSGLGTYLSSIGNASKSSSVIYIARRSDQ